MSKIIKIVGNSSHKLIKEITLNSNSNKSLLDLLRELSIPVASSCFGEGICKKCMINDNIISCQISEKEFYKISAECNNTITINYL